MYKWVSLEVRRAKHVGVIGLTVGLTLASVLGLQPSIALAQSQAQAPNTPPCTARDGQKIPGVEADWNPPFCKGNLRLSFADGDVTYDSFDTEDRHRIGRGFRLAVHELRIDTQDRYIDLVDEYEQRRRFTKMVFGSGRATRTKYLANDLSGDYIERLIPTQRGENPNKYVLKSRPRGGVQYEYTPHNAGSLGEVLVLTKITHSLSAAMALYTEVRTYERNSIRPAKYTISDRGVRSFQQFTYNKNDLTIESGLVGSVPTKNIFKRDSQGKVLIIEEDVPGSGVTKTDLGYYGNTDLINALVVKSQGVSTRYLHDPAGYYTGYTTTTKPDNVETNRVIRYSSGSIEIMESSVDKDARDNASANSRSVYQYDNKQRLVGVHAADGSLQRITYVEPVSDHLINQDQYAGRQVELPESVTINNDRYLTTNYEYHPIPEAWSSGWLNEQAVHRAGLIMKIGSADGYQQFIYEPTEPWRTLTESATYRFDGVLLDKSKYLVNGFGSLVKQEDEDTNSGQVYRTTYTLDRNSGQVIGTDTFLNNNLISGMSGRVEYNQAGGVARIRDGSGYITSIHRDALERIDTIDATPGGGGKTRTTTYKYSPASILTRKTEAVGRALFSTINTLRNGRVEEVTNTTPLGITTLSALKENQVEDGAIIGVSSCVGAGDKKFCSSRLENPALEQCKLPDPVVSRTPREWLQSLPKVEDLRKACQDSERGYFTALYEDKNLRLYTHLCPLLTSSGSEALCRSTTYNTPAKNSCVENGRYRPFMAEGSDAAVNLAFEVATGLHVYYNSRDFHENPGFFSVAWGDAPPNPNMFDLDRDGKPIQPDPCAMLTWSPPIDYAIPQYRIAPRWRIFEQGEILQCRNLSKRVWVAPDGRYHEYTGTSSDRWEHEYDFADNIIRPATNQEAPNGGFVRELRNNDNDVVTYEIYRKWGADCDARVPRNCRYLLHSVEQRRPGQTEPLDRVEISYLKVNELPYKNKPYHDDNIRRIQPLVSRIKRFPLGSSDHPEAYTIAVNWENPSPAFTKRRGIDDQPENWGLGTSKILQIGSVGTFDEQPAFGIGIKVDKISSINQLSFRYDYLGRLSSYSSFSPAGKLVGTLSYSYYGASDRLWKIESDEGTRKNPIIEERQYGYDSDGRYMVTYKRPTPDGSQTITNVVYEPSCRMKQVQTIAGDFFRTSYSYDSAGKRVTRVDQGVGPATALSTTYDWFTDTARQGLLKQIDGTLLLAPQQFDYTGRILSSWTDNALRIQRSLTASQENITVSNLALGGATQTTTRTLDPSTGRPSGAQINGVALPISVAWNKLGFVMSHSGDSCSVRVGLEGAQMSCSGPSGTMQASSAFPQSYSQPATSQLSINGQERINANTRLSTLRGSSPYVASETISHSSSGFQNMKSSSRGRQGLPTNIFLGGTTGGSDQSFEGREPATCRANEQAAPTPVLTGGWSETPIHDVCALYELIDSPDLGSQGVIAYYSRGLDIDQARYFRSYYQSQTGRDENELPVEKFLHDLPPDWKRFCQMRAVACCSSREPQGTLPVLSSNTAEPAMEDSGECGGPADERHSNSFLSRRIRLVPGCLINGCVEATAKLSHSRTMGDTAGGVYIGGWPGYAVDQSLIGGAWIGDSGQKKNSNGWQWYSYLNWTAREDRPWWRWAADSVRVNWGLHPWGWHFPFDVPLPLKDDKLRDAGYYFENWETWIDRQVRGWLDDFRLVVPSDSEEPGECKVVPINKKRGLIGRSNIWGDVYVTATWRDDRWRYFGWQEWRSEQRHKDNSVLVNRLDFDDQLNFSRTGTDLELVPRVCSGEDESPDPEPGPEPRPRPSPSPGPGGPGSGNPGGPGSGNPGWPGIDRPGHRPPARPGFGEDDEDPHNACSEGITLEQADPESQLLKAECHNYSSACGDNQSAKKDEKDISPLEVICGDVRSTCGGTTPTTASAGKVLLSGVREKKPTYFELSAKVQGVKVGAHSQTHRTNSSSATKVHVPAKLAIGGDGNTPQTKVRVKYTFTCNPALTGQGFHSTDEVTSSAQVSGMVCEVQTPKSNLSVEKVERRIDEKTVEYKWRVKGKVTIAGADGKETTEDIDEVVAQSYKKFWIELPPASPFVISSTIDAVSQAQDLLGQRMELAGEIESNLKVSLTCSNATRGK